MLNFEFCNPARVIFGKGVESRVGEQVAQYSKRVLLHYGGGSIKKSGLFDKVVASLKQNGIEYVELGGVQPNPRLSLAKEGIRLCREHKLDFILALGGGSVIDSAKCISVGVPYDGDVWDFYGSDLEPTKAVPVGVVLTIPAAGSETSPSSVITKADTQDKHDCTARAMIPKFAIMNPEYTYTLPSYQTAAGGTDILAHLMERYFTTVGHVDLTDRLLEASMRTLIINLPKAIANPDNYDVRAEIMWVGTLAHNNLLDTGREGDWASHMIEHELSALYDIAHGAGLAIVFPAWMKYVHKHKIERFVQFAVRVMDVDLAFEDSEAIALDGIARLETFYRSIGMPVRLSDIGKDGSDIALMAKKAAFRGNLGHFMSLDEQDIANIYKLAL